MSNAAPISSETPINVTITNDLKKVYKEILEKHLDGREFNENKILTWMNNILIDAKEYFIKKYNKYDLFLYVYTCPRNVYFHSNCYSISLKNIDWVDFVNFQTDKMFSSLYFFFYSHVDLKYSIDDIESEIIQNANEIIEKYLEGRNYNLVQKNNYSNNINVDETNFIINKENKCRCFFLNEIYQNPIKSKFYFKYLSYGKDIYSKIMQTYVNDSLKCYHYTFFFK